MIRQPSTKMHRRTSVTNPTFSCRVRAFSSQFYAIPSLDCAPLDDVPAHFAHYHSKQTPVLLKGLVSNQRAVKKWSNLDYLCDTVVPDCVADVEQGAYNNSGGERLTVPFDGYIEYLKQWEEQYSTTEIAKLPAEQVLYLAQNDLHHFGALKNDVTISEICTDTRCGSGKLYSVMLWLGPRGSVSPMHYDPLDNLLMQMVGRKKAWLGMYCM
jgi:lysine-specific demethylase 8